MPSHLQTVLSFSALTGKVQLRRVRSSLIGSEGIISMRFSKISMVGLSCPDMWQDRLFKLLCSSWGVVNPICSIGVLISVSCGVISFAGSGLVFETIRKRSISA